MAHGDDKRLCNCGDPDCKFDHEKCDELATMIGLLANGYDELGQGHEFVTAAIRWFAEVVVNNADTLEEARDGFQLLLDDLTAEFEDRCAEKMMLTELLERAGKDLH